MFTANTLSYQLLMCVCVCVQGWGGGACLTGLLAARGTLTSNVTSMPLVNSTVMAPFLVALIMIMISSSWSLSDTARKWYWITGSQLIFFTFCSASCKTRPYSKCILSLSQAFFKIFLWTIQNWKYLVATGNRTQTPCLTHKRSATELRQPAGKQTL